MILRIFMVCSLLIISVVVGAPDISGAPSLRKVQTIELLIEEQERKEEIKTLENSEFTPTNLKRYLELMELDFTDVILRQAILETGWFNSSSFKQGNNLFGMRVPKKRETLANGSYLAHARYKHWTDSVKDYKMWQKYHINRGKSTDNYYAFLTSIGYATAGNYIDTLKRINLDRLEYA